MRFITILIGVTQSEEACSWFVLSHRMTQHYECNYSILIAKHSFS